MSAQWIDFKELRRKLRFQEVLSHYRIDAKVNGDRATALCALPDHPSRDDGKRRTPSLSIHLGRGIWRCFGCGQSGNVLEFIARMEGLDPNDPRDLRRAALKAIDLFRLSDSKPVLQKTKTEPARVEPQSLPPAQKALPIRVNPPLDFELKHLESNHPYLQQRGLTAETIAYFGLGFCGKGLMKDRIAIPLRDTTGSLIGYAGRLVDDTCVSETTPKYLFPGHRERNGEQCEFHKGEFLYHGYGLRAPVLDLIVVEGFSSVWWLWQNGWRTTVALMGNSVSAGQSKCLCDLLDCSGRLWILTDGDEAGERGAYDLFRKIAPHRAVRRAGFAPGQQPTDLSKASLAALLPHLT